MNKFTFFCLPATTAFPHQNNIPKPALRLYPHFQHLSRTSCFYLSFRCGTIGYVPRLSCNTRRTRQARFAFHKWALLFTYGIRCHVAKICMHRHSAKQNTKKIYCIKWPVGQIIHRYFSPSPGLSSVPVQRPLSSCRLHIPSILSPHRIQRMGDLPQRARFHGLHQAFEDVFVAHG